MKCVQHSRHGTIFRMPNEDAELLVSSGRYVFISKFAARDATVKPRRRSWLIGAALAFTALAALLWAGTAKAADKQVPFKICLTQSQAAQVYKGKHLKYRLVKDEHGRQEACYYAGATLPKHAFYVGEGMHQRPRDLRASDEQNLRKSSRSEPTPVPRTTGVAVAPTRLDTDVQARVQGPDVSITSAGFTPFTATLVEDAVKALTGVPEAYFTFDAVWSRAMKDAAGQ